MNVKRIYWIAVAVTFCGLMAVSEGRAQVQRKVIQLSGVILGEDSIHGLPGVHVYVPKAGRGTTTNSVGFFSMPVVVGDSLIVSSIGYVRRHYIVPDYPKEYMTIVLEMTKDNTMLPVIEVNPFPTEEVFKQAVLALNVPMNDKSFNNRNFNAELMALMLKTTPMDGAMNYRYYMDQYNTSIMDKSQVRVNPFLNPFNWARFFRDLKNNKK